jgi:hypothetical protein
MTPELIARIRGLPSEVILNVASLCDGHSILAPQAFLDAGLPKEFVDQVTTTHRSDTSSPKSTIFVGGKAVEELRGVYGLQMLRTLAHVLDIQYRDCIGRGFEASNIKEAIAERYKQPPSA